MTNFDDFVAGFADEEPGYLDYGHVGPLSVAAREERRVHELALTHARYGTIARIEAEEDARFRNAVAALTGFSADQVSFQPNTSTGLLHATFGLTGGEVLLSPHEFPSLTYAATRAAQALHVITPLWLKSTPGRVTPADIRDQLTPTTSAVMVSLVDSRTGYLADIDGIRQVIGDRILIVDAVQGLGLTDAPYEVADVVVCGGHKWLRAGWGAGFLALSERVVEHLTPVFSGWSGSTSGEVPWDEVRDPVAGAGAFTATAPDSIAEASFAAALEEISTVGVAAIESAVSAGVERVLSIADEYGLPVSSPRAVGERAGIVVLEPPAERVSGLGAQLFNHGVTATLRPRGVRLSVHAGTNEETFEMLTAALTAYASAN